MAFRTLKVNIISVRITLYTTISLAICKSLILALVVYKHCTDTNKGPLNKNPKEDLQMKPFEPVDRLRRILLHDVENNVSFFMVGFLYTLLGVGCDNAMKSYTYLSFARYVAHLTRQKMQVRAILWVLMSLSFMTICIQMMVYVLRYGNENVAEEKLISHSTL